MKITTDSREVTHGDTFVAIKGENADGHDFIEEAVKRGAATVVGEKDIKVTGAKYIKVKDARETLGQMASEFFGNPSNKLKIIGVTGTKGKTTTAHLIYHILTALGKKVGLVSSIVAKIGSKEKSTGFHITSPDVVSLHSLLSEMVDAGCEYAVIEVSSHGIVQKRVAGIDFAVSVLTNIAPEHLDYHKTFKEYKKTKMSFVKSAKISVIAPKDTTLNILPGKFNNLNAEAAIEATARLGFAKEEVIKTLSSFKLPEGRLEKIENKGGCDIYIDFAHTTDSLKVLLEYLRTKTKGRLVVVFGCAGERDVKKRLQMGKVAAKLADLSVFTAEDPRSEDIFKIMARMAKGAKSVGGIEGKNFVRIPERGEAIAFTLSEANPNDLVVFAGKSHEKSMAYRGFENPWSDREFIENYLKADNEISVIVLAGGKGSRMRSRYPKIVHEICGRPMVAYTLENLRRTRLKNIIAVVSYRKNLVIRRIKGAVKVAVQKNPKGGTADAAEAGFKSVTTATKIIVVINGDDSAFYKPETIKDVIATHKKLNSMLTFVSLEKDNPAGLGRVLRDEEGEVSGIIEEKNASEEQRLIKEVNDGLYVFDRKWLETELPRVKKNPVTGERYITDLIARAIEKKDKVVAYKLKDSEEWQGINTPEELAKAVTKMEARLNG